MAVIDDSIVKLYLGPCGGNAELKGIYTEMIPVVESVIAGFLGWYPSLRTTTEVLPGERGTVYSPFGIDFGPGSLNGASRTGTGRFPGAQGNQLPFLSLQYRPVRTITSVYADPNAQNQGDQTGGTWAAESLQDPKTYYLDVGKAGSPPFSFTGKLYRRFAGYWDSNPRSIKVTYQSGLTADELTGDYADIRYAYGLTLSAFVAKTLAARSVSSAATSGMLAGKKVASVSVRDFSVSLDGGAGAGQFGGGTGGNSGGAGSGIPDEAVSYLAKRVAMSKWLNR